MRAYVRRRNGRDYAAQATGRVADLSARSTTRLPVAQIGGCRGSAPPRRSRFEALIARLGLRREVRAAGLRAAFPRYPAGRRLPVDAQTSHLPTREASTKLMAQEGERPDRRPSRSSRRSSVAACRARKPADQCCRNAPPSSDTRLHGRVALARDGRADEQGHADARRPDSRSPAAGGAARPSDRLSRAHRMHDTAMSFDARRRHGTSATMNPMPRPSGRCGSERETEKAHQNVKRSE